MKSNSKSKKIENRLRRKQRIRKKVYGTPECPRLTVYRSLRHIYAQLIDDLNQKTLLSVSTLSKSLTTEIGKTKTKIDAAKLVGTHLAKESVKKEIKKVVFDRNGFDYHGRVKALAEAARKEGLKF